MLQAWLQSLCTAASTNTPALRVPLYDFLETASYYPPEAPVTSSDPTAASSQHTAVATPAATTATTGVPVAAAYAEALPPAAGAKDAGVTSAGPLPPRPDADGWAVPLESRDASDLKMAMTGPSAAGKLTGEQAAEALRTGTGAGQEDLRAVWELSDIDRDGMLDRDEVCAEMHDV